LGRRKSEKKGLDHCRKKEHASQHKKGLDIQKRIKREKRKESYLTRRRSQLRFSWMEKYVDLKARKYGGGANQEFGHRTP